MQQENIPVKVGLLELLYGSQGTQFVIPAYQRNYTWVANKEVKQLLDDIKVVLNEVEGWRADLKDDGILREDNQQLVFASNHFFYPKRVNATALSTTAAIILHGSRNGWEYWLSEDGVQLGQVEGIRKNNE